MYMEMSRGNSPIAILSKVFVSSTKSENRRAEQGLPGEVGTSGRGRMWGEGVGG
jgi:hypothetical protein